jgi:hypothetical protein
VDARVVSLRSDVEAYVSYRIGDEIFWTRKPITLHKNENVIKDASIEVRMRCGNRVSATPQLPISLREPAPEALERVQVPEDLDALAAPMDSNLNVRLLPNVVPVDHSFGTTKSGAFVAPTVQGMWWGLSSPPIVLFESRPLSYPPAPPRSPILTPEPSTRLLLLLALSAGGIFGQIRTAQPKVIL